MSNETDLGSEGQDRRVPDAPGADREMITSKHIHRRRIKARRGFDG